MFARNTRSCLYAGVALVTASLSTLHCGSAEPSGSALDTPPLDAPATPAGSPLGDATTRQGSPSSDAPATPTAPSSDTAAPGEVPAPTAGELILDRTTESRISGEYTNATARIQLAAVSSAPLAGDVSIKAGAMTYDLHYDFEAREVITDGHGGALDRPTHLLLADVLSAVAERLGQNDPTLPLPAQMLYAGLAMLEDSAGMPLPRMTFPLGPVAGEPSQPDEPSQPSEPGSATLPGEVDKSLGDDGVTCISRDTTYAVSFDVGSTVVTDEPVVAGSDDCNGQCGPGCTRLTPYVMWTLDCLEHDTCCGATSADPCWTPLGECGDEYADAEADFLRGFDPFAHHCGG